MNSHDFKLENREQCNNYPVEELHVRLVDFVLKIYCISETIENIKF